MKKVKLECLCWALIHKQQIGKEKIRIIILSTNSHTKIRKEKTRIIVLTTNLQTNTTKEKTRIIVLSINSQKINYKRENLNVSPEHCSLRCCRWIQGNCPFFSDVVIPPPRYPPRHSRCLLCTPRSLVLWPSLYAPNSRLLLLAGPLPAAPSFPSLLQCSEVTSLITAGRKDTAREGTKRQSTLISCNIQSLQHQSDVVWITIDVIT